jgi:hypothetical protein
VSGHDSAEQEGVYGAAHENVYGRGGWRTVYLHRSRGRALALNERNFSVVNKITPPVPVFISKKGTPLGVK